MTRHTIQVPKITSGPPLTLAEVEALALAGLQAHGSLTFVHDNMGPSNIGIDVNPLELEAETAPVSTGTATIVDKGNNYEVTFDKGFAFKEVYRKL